MRAVRAVACVEAAKGVLALAAASGLAAASQHDAGAWVARAAEHLHLNPASRYPAILLHAAVLQEARVTWIAFGALAYALVRLIEAYGLFFERIWAEGLAAASGAIYNPGRDLRTGPRAERARAGAVGGQHRRRGGDGGRTAAAPNGGPRRPPDMTESALPTTGGR